MIRLLGNSPESNNIRSIYSLEDERVYIVFSHPTESFQECAKNLPIGTVLLIQITPKKERQLTDFGVDEEKCEKFDPTQPKGLGFMGYLDLAEGIIVRTQGKKVDEVNYIASAKDVNKCAEYYANPKIFIQMIVDFK